MDARQRRYQMFLDELGGDLRRFRSFMAKEDHAAIRNLAHKYKMRLAYFGYDEALEQCRTIALQFNQGRLKEQIEETQKLVDILEAIPNQLQHEGTDH